MTTNAPLTERQQQVLDFIRQHFTTRQGAPTVREIAAHFHMASPKAVQDHLAALERKGCLTRTPGRTRNIRLTVSPESGLPIVGRVAAGRPIAAVENIVGSLDFAHLFGSDPLFAVLVAGDSMTGFGILDGDYVVVRRQSHVENGTIAVVYVNGEVTVKKLTRTSAGYRLVPGNPAYPAVDIGRDTPEFSIAGPVVGVVRKGVYAA